MNKGYDAAPSAAYGLRGLVSVRPQNPLRQGRKEAYLDAAKKCRENGAVKVPYETVEQFANKLADHFEGLAELWGEK